MDKILSMVAAPPGWYAVFENDFELIFNHVAVWVVIRNEDGERVTGFSESADGFIEADDGAVNFVGWKYLPNRVNDHAA